MKNLLLIMIFAFLSSLNASAQQEKKVEALKIAFLTEKLQLTPSEAKEFWPIYNNYQNEIRELRLESKGGDVLENEQKLLDLRKRFKPSFTKVLGPEKVNTLFTAEKEFRNILIKRLKKGN